MVCYGIGFIVDVVFFMYFYVDYYLGIIGFLCMLGMMGCFEFIYLYGLFFVKCLFYQVVYLGVEFMFFLVEIYELKDGDVVLCKGYLVYVVGVDYCINVLGYVLVEDDCFGCFNLDMVCVLGVLEGFSFGKF